MPTNQPSARLSEGLRREEDPAHFRDILATLEAEFQPSGPLEQFLVREMACAHWRRRRAYYTTLQTLEKSRATS